MIKNIKKIPLFWILFGWNIMFVYYAFRVLWIASKMLVGYWQCDRCGKWFWINDEKIIDVQGWEKHCRPCNVSFHSKIIRPPKGVGSIKRPASTMIWFDQNTIHNTFQRS
jgi:hypothetical protein